MQLSAIIVTKSVTMPITFLITSQKHVMILASSALVTIPRIEAFLKISNLEHELQHVFCIQYLIQISQQSI